MELAKYEAGKNNLVTVPAPAQLSDPQDPLGENEDWDREANGANFKTYDPQKKCEKMKVLRRLQGATPSER